MLCKIPAILFKKHSATDRDSGIIFRYLMQHSDKCTYSHDINSRWEQNKIIYTYFFSTVAFHFSFKYTVFCLHKVYIIVLKINYKLNFYSADGLSYIFLKKCHKLFKYFTF